MRMVVREPLEEEEREPLEEKVENRTVKKSNENEKIEEQA